MKMKTLGVLVFCGMLCVAQVANCGGGKKKKGSSGSGSTTSGSGSSGSTTSDSGADNTPDPSPYQSSARPFSIPIHDVVMLSGSDDRSAEFNNTWVQHIYEEAAKMVKSGMEFQDRGSHKLDATKLFLTYDTEYPVRVYFIAEGAGYHNCLGFSSTIAGANNEGEMKYIFPDSSMPSSSGTNMSISNLNNRSNWEPLHPGDFVTLGDFSAGTQLDFFLVRDGVNGGRHIFTNHEEDNPDKIQHTFAMVIPDSPFLLIGFEDLYGGGDLDYEDVLFVVDIGMTNAETYEKLQSLPN